MKFMIECRIVSDDSIDTHSLNHFHVADCVTDRTVPRLLCQKRNPKHWYVHRSVTGITIMSRLIIPLYTVHVPMAAVPLSLKGSKCASACFELCRDRSFITDERAGLNSSMKCSERRLNFRNS